MAAILFDYVLVVKYKKNEAGPVISFKFPQVIDVKDEIAAAVPSFCFPEGQGVSLQSKKETFSFTLTTGSGDKRFGYCRRFIASGCEPECYCIVSQNSSFNLFSEILDIVEERRTSSSSAVFTFLKSLQAQPVPNAGQRFTISTFSAIGASEPDKYELKMPMQNDFLLDYVSYETLFQCLDIDSIITLFECLLLESRTIFVSKKLSRLSECVNAASAMLNPFSWQYVFIPVLPTSLLGYCCAPMPFIVGITSNSLTELSQLPIEEVIMIDLDKGTFPRIPEESKVLDDSMREYLRTSLHKIKSACKSGDKTFDLNVARCFISLMFRFCGCYKLFLTPTCFKRDDFLESQPPQYLHAVQKIVESQMWSVFEHEREEMLKQGKIDSCLLVKTGNNLWHSNDLSVQCTKCGASVTSNINLKRNKIICSACFNAKRDTFTLGSLRKFKTLMKRGSASVSAPNVVTQETESSNLSKRSKGSAISASQNKRMQFKRQLSGPLTSPRSLRSLVSPRSTPASMDDLDVSPKKEGLCAPQTLASKAKMQSKTVTIASPGLARSRGRGRGATRGINSPYNPRSSVPNMNRGRPRRGNAERGRGNAERGRGNAERGRGNTERGRGNRPRTNTDVQSRAKAYMEKLSK